MVITDDIQSSKDKSEFGIFSFFTGAGFLDLGFEAAGFKSYFANEIDPNFAEVYRYSRKQMRVAAPVFGLQEGNVCDFVKNRKASASLSRMISDARETSKFVGFIGGPPCPDFSVANANAKGEHGDRGMLTRIYVELICKQNPDFFVLENVKGLLRTAKHRAFFDRMVKRLRRNGYATSFRLINALEYGVAQDRQRVILIGVKEAICGNQNIVKGEIQNFPWDDFVEYPIEEVQGVEWPTTNPFEEGGKLVAPPNIIRHLTVQYWFEKNDVANHPNSNDYFTPRAGLAKMQTYAEGDDSKKCYKRIHRWRYSPTACYGNNEVHLHPYRARRLSVAETLAIQSLPKRFSLPPSIPLSAKFKTIGNGVPYLAAYGVAKTLYHFLKGLTDNGTTIHSK